MGKTLVTPRTATADSIIPDFETAKVGGIGKRCFGMLPDVGAQLALADGFHEGAHFVFFARGHELDAAIAQIPHGTCDIEALGYVPDGIAKANALDVSFVENLNRRDHPTRRLIRPSPTATTEGGFCVTARGPGAADRDLAIVLGEGQGGGRLS
jgi:hypothetical protein